MKPSIQEPLRFKRIFLEKVWGGRALGDSPESGGLGLQLPEGMQVGETWELVDRSDVCSVVKGGNFDGLRLDQLMASNKTDLLGDLEATREGRFPLLVKYIDAAQHLSVQVHPDDARAADGADGWEAKTEAWVILGVTEGGRIYHGFNPDVTHASLGADLAAGRTIEPSLRSFVPVAGECYFVPGGTVHAIGAGVTLIEVQQNSDTTFRVDDWGRMGLDGEPRELHVDAALECFDFGEAPKPVRPEGACTEPLELAKCAAFSMGVVDIDASRSGSTRTDAGSEPIVVACVRGAGVVLFAGREMALGLGDVLLLPAALGDFEIKSTSDAPLRLINMRGPRPAKTLPA